MIAYRPILYITGILLCVLAGVMLVPAAVDAYYYNSDWQVFLKCSLLTLFVGGVLVFTMRSKSQRISVRQAFILTTLNWLLIGVFGALPFMLSELELSFVDAFFESTSGITTTGSTVLTGLNTLPPGILMWRSLLQWLGGVGIIVMAVSVMPFLQVGGMQMFQMELTSNADKVLPRTAQISFQIIAIYVTLTAVCALALNVAGMPGFDAINHAMTTLATGGYSTHDASVGHFDSATIDWIIVLFLILASLPFLQYLKAVNTSARTLFQDPQIQAFLKIVLAAVAFMTILLIQQGYTPLDGLRYAAFNTISILTGTGYTSTDYMAWGSFAVSVLIVLMFVGGCAGSTTCGIKVFRFQILTAHVSTQLKRLRQPHGVFLPQYGGRPIPENITLSVTSFFYLYIFFFALITALLSLMNMDFMTALSGAATSLSNVGPGMGDTIGPSGNFSSLTDPAKLVMSAAMYLGRLELFTILVLFMPSFWRN